MKYHPSFPARFGGIEDGTSFCRAFFPWYNTEHRHSGLELLTPRDVHYGCAEAVLAQRQAVLEAAYRAHPERFVRGMPSLQLAPKKVWINALKSPGAKLQEVQ